MPAGCDAAALRGEGAACAPLELCALLPVVLAPRSLPELARLPLTPLLLLLPAVGALLVPAVLPELLLLLLLLLEGCGKSAKHRTPTDKTHNRCARQLCRIKHPLLLLHAHCKMQSNVAYAQWVQNRKTTLE
jgi:hypothetical protein